MVLKPQDLVVVLKLVSLEEQKNKAPSMAGLGVSLSISSSEVFAAIKRATSAGLAVKDERGLRPHLRNLEEFLEHGVRFVFVPDRGGVVRGMPTSVAALPLKNKFNLSPEDLLPVWPDPEGEARGESFSPLYPSVPQAAKKDPNLYQLLALVDAIRGGRVREREMAIKELVPRIRNQGKRG